MITIWKYKIEVTDEVVIKMPKGAEVLSVGVQFGKDVCLWVKINTDNELEDRKFNIYGTGHPIYKTDQRFIGTFQLFNGEGIFHLFE